MKKRILLVTLMVAILVCVFAISVSASVSTAYDKTEKVTVTLTNGTQECALYDADGDELVWYTLDGGATVTSIKAKDLTITYANDGNSLQQIYLDADKKTCLQRIGEKTYNCIVVANLRGLTFTTLPNSNYVGLFEDSPIVQYVYLPVTIASIECNHFLRATNMKVCDFPEDARYAFVNSNVFNGASALEEINLAGLTSVKGSQHFIGCTSLKRVIGFEKSTITFLGDNMFQNSGLVEIAIPNTVTTIGKQLFYGSSELETVSFGAGLTTLGAYDAVKNCPSLKTVYMSSTVATLSVATFEGATNVEVIFYTGTKEQADAFRASAADSKNRQNHILNATLISATEYNALLEKSGVYIVYDYSVCDAFYNGKHSTSQLSPCVAECSNCGDKIVNHISDYESAVVTYANGFMDKGQKTVTCASAGCGFKFEKELNPLFTCLGYSAPEDDGRSGIAVGYTINNDAIKEYKKATGKTLTYGVFAVAKAKLGTNDIFDESGKAISVAIVAEISEYNFVSVELKITGFTDEKKDAKLAMGMYVSVTDEECTEYSYLQNGAPSENEKYFFISYNDVVKKPSTDEEVA